MTQPRNRDSGLCARFFARVGNAVLSLLRGRSKPGECQMEADNATQVIEKSPPALVAPVPCYKGKPDVTAQAPETAAPSQSFEALRKMRLRHQIQNEIRRKEIRDESRAMLEAEE